VRRSSASGSAHTRRMNDAPSRPYSPRTLALHATHCEKRPTVCVVCTHTAQQVTFPCTYLSESANVRAYLMRHGAQATQFVGYLFGAGVESCGCASSQRMLHKTDEKLCAQTSCCL
jgi:hypothetical protein